MNRPWVKATERPWWINASERPPEYAELAEALVDEGLCAWDGRGAPHPQEYALVALWTLVRDAKVTHERRKPA